ncbi:MAG TPA: hypothetical protein VFI72_18995 [Candidatus Angelobacter sp.]|nr:hypothetical protein [Candidatus Angelobacter sp.]
MNLYRTRTIAASLLLALLASVAPAQRRQAHKLRATGVLELTTDRAGNVTARLTPVVILDDGRFHDASIYKARPRPMAAENGIVYEVQKTGTPIGYVTLGTATETGGIWTALCKWQPISAVPKKATASATPAPAAPGSPGGRPILRRPESEGGSSSAPTSASTSPTPAPTPETTPEPEPEDTDRPVLRRRAPAPTQPESQASPSPVPAGTPGPASAPEGAVPPNVPYVPTPGTQTLVAVSDTQPSDTRSYEYNWSPEDRQKMEAKLRRLALAQLPPENAKLGDNSLRNVVIRSFDVDLSNEAVMVLTAEIPGSYMTQSSRSAPGKFVSRYITLIARTDYDQNLQRLGVSITDSSRLDVAPRLELIDAVDVDGDGLAELMFREYGFDQKGYMIYGIGRGTVTKVFEGATSPLSPQEQEQLKPAWTKPGD